MRNQHKPSKKMQGRTLTGARAISAATCMILVLSSYMPSAFAESPPQDNSIGDLVAVPVKPEPPVNPCNTKVCDNAAVDLTTCLDPDGCETPIKPIDEFTTCLDLVNGCDTPIKPIDELITPPGPEDPGDDDGPGDEDEPGDDEPGDDEPGDEGEQPEDPGPEEPETPEPTDTPEPTEPETPKTPTPSGETPTPVDIDTPRPGNPNFTG